MVVVVFTDPVEPSSSQTLCVGRSTGDSLTSSDPLEDNDRVSPSLFYSASSLHCNFSASYIMACILYGIIPLYIAFIMCILTKASILMYSF